MKNRRIHELQSFLVSSLYKYLGVTPKEALAVSGAVIGLLIGGAEGPTVQSQICFNLAGLGLFTVCVWPAIRKG